MTVIATALFGSRARGDYHDTSDVDVLLWTDERYPRHIRRGQSSLAYYPERLLLAKARSGDLFAAHIVLEAIALKDPVGRLDNLRDAYRPPASYIPQIAAAANLAWFLIDHGDALDAKLVNARAAWCARTIAIARSAEDGEPTFSTGMLVNRTGSIDLATLIEAKDHGQSTLATAQLLERFVLLYGRPRPLSGERPAALDYKCLFTRSNNEFGLKTMRQSGLKNETGAYV